MVDLAANCIVHYKMNDVYPWKELADMPANKEQHGFEELDGKLYAVMGYNGVYVNTNYCYDIEGGTWSSKTVAPYSAQSPVLRAVNGKLYLIGGYNHLAGTYYDHCYEYDPTGNDWTEKASMPTGREDMGSAVIDNKIYVFGGITTGAARTKKVEVYDPATNEWDTLNDLPDYKLLGDFACSYNVKAYLISGTNTLAGYPNLTSNTVVWRYDPVGDDYTALTGPTTGHCYKEVVELSGLIYSMGGAVVEANTSISVNKIYDVFKDSWSDGPDVPDTKNVGMGMTKYGELIYVSGGYTSGPVYSKKLYSYDPRILYVAGDGIKQAKDSSGNAHHGDLARDTSLVTTPGKIRKAFLFDDTENDYISSGDHSDFSFGDGVNDSPFSISSWINLNSVDWFVIASKQAGAGTQEYRFSVISSGKIYMILFNNLASAIYRGRYYNTPIAAEQWHHIVGTYDGRGGADAEDGIKIYLNHVRVDDTDFNAGVYVAMDDGAQPLWIGRWGSFYADGKMDSTIIFDKEVSQDEVDFLWNSGYGTERLSDKHTLPLVGGGLAR